ncbi:substrate-binding periplasmic protein [Chitinimonas sp. BJB300]|uniref:substrate-binding periplasmic protein n=1 Tax=Chitinimonas sp. BJB300 TaxID=1559339 RepID=UPI00130435F3|nr:transporter substrate-binding domain-containing protein [Chitinimonas sp. BJB300]
MWQTRGEIGGAWLALALATCPTLADKQTVVLIGDEDYSPYSYADAAGVAHGIYADILHKVSATMPNFTIELKTEPWKRALKTIEVGEAAGFYPPYKKLDVRPSMEYSLPLLVETVVLVCSSKISRTYKGATWPAGFAGLRFGNNTGFFILGKPFFDMVAAGELKLDEAKTTESNLLKLIKGRIDCYANDRRAIETEAKRLKLDMKDMPEVAVLGKEFSYVGYTSKRAKFPYLPAFMKEFDEAVIKLRAEGQIPVPE